MLNFAGRKKQSFSINFFPSAGESLQKTSPEEKGGGKKLSYTVKKEYKLVTTFLVTTLPMSNQQTRGVDYISTPKTSHKQSYKDMNRLR